MTKKEFLTKFNLAKLIKKGENIYKQNINKYEIGDKGKYMAIEPESGNVYVGRCLFEVLMLARKICHYNLLYIARIGYDEIRIDLSAKISV